MGCLSKVVAFETANRSHQMQSAHDSVLHGSAENRWVGWGLIGATLIGEIVVFLLLDLGIRNGIIAPQSLEVYLLVFFSLPFVFSTANAWFGNGLVFSLAIGLTPTFLFIVIYAIGSLRGNVVGDTSILPILLILVFIGATVSMIGFGIGMVSRSINESD